MMTGAERKVCIDCNAVSIFPPKGLCIESNGPRQFGKEKIFAVKRACSQMEQIHLFKSSFHLKVWQMCPCQS